LGRKLVQASVFALPFKDKSFDEIIFSNVIEHIPESPVIISEMKRVLKKGGLLVVGTPDYSRVSWLFFEWIYGVILPRAYAGEHITKYTYGLLYKKLQDMGFRVITKKYICGSEMIVKACL
jgi:ubiquinone/menaquinone biosynthesis C-methylase UbiE